MSFVEPTVEKTPPKPLEVSKAWNGPLPGDKQPKTDIEKGLAACARLRDVIEQSRRLRTASAAKFNSYPSTGFANRYMGV